MAAVLIVDPGLPHAPSGFHREMKYNMQNPTAASTSEFYHFRGKDSGHPGSTPYYVSWTGTTSTTGYSGVPPFGGPIVDIVVRRVK